MFQVPQTLSQRKRVPTIPSPCQQDDQELPPLSTHHARLTRIARLLVMLQHTQSLSCCTPLSVTSCTPLRVTQHLQLDAQLIYTNFDHGCRQMRMQE
jgi:hypothetical protein